MLLNEYEPYELIMRSFLSLKNNFKCNIYDELDVVIDSNEFKIMMITFLQ